MKRTPKWVQSSYINTIGREFNWTHKDCPQLKTVRYKGLRFPQYNVCPCPPIGHLTLSEALNSQGQIQDAVAYLMSAVCLMASKDTKHIFDLSQVIILTPT